MSKIEITGFHIEPSIVLLGDTWDFRIMRLIKT